MHRKYRGYCKQKIGHKATLYNLPCVNTAGNREDFFCVKLYHGALIIFTVDREEVEKFSDMLFVAVKVTFVPGSFRDEVICKLLENRKRPGRIEVEYIGVLLSVGVAVRICEQTWILARKAACI